MKANTFTPRTWKTYAEIIAMAHQSEILVLGEDAPYIGKEDQFQRAAARFLDYLRFHWMHPPNEGSRSDKTGSNLKAKGMKPGASDIIILEPCPCASYVVIELKTKGNNMTDDQEQFLKKSAHCGARAFCCYNMDSLEAVIRVFYPHKFKI